MGEIINIKGYLRGQYRGKHDYRIRLHMDTFNAYYEKHLKGDVKKQKEFCRECGFNYCYFDQVKRGDVTLIAGSLVNMAKVMQVDLLQLVDYPPIFFD